MRKGIKILGKLISTIVLLLIFLPIITTLVLNVESVQNAVVKRASRYASNYLGTDVYVDGIDFDLFSKIRIRGLYVEDYNQDTLLYVAHATTNIGGLNIAKDGLRLSNTKMYGAKFYLRELPSGKMNIRPLVEQLQSGDKSGGFRLYIDDVEAEKLSFCLEKLEPRNPEYGVDVKNLHLDNISAHLTNFAVVQGAVWMDIERLAMTERSGFDVSELSSHLYINHGEMAFEGLRIDTGSSLLDMPTLVFKGDGWQSYRRFVREVELSAAFEHSHISTSDIAYFVPSLRDRDMELKSFTATVEGALSDMELMVKRAKVGLATDIALSCSVVGLPNWREARYAIGIERLRAKSRDVLAVVDRLSSEGMPEELRRVIERVEWVDMRATMGGLLSDLRVVGNLSSGVGDMSGDISMKRREDGRMAVVGAVQSADLNIGDILSVESLDAITSNVTFNGSVGDAQSGGVVGDVGVAVESLGYGGYTFSSIKGDSHIVGSDYLVHLRSSDPNLKFDLRADLCLNPENPTYTASLALKRADLSAMGINRRDSVSVLSANIGVDIQGIITEGVNGFISIADIEYDYPQGRFEDDRVKVEFGNQGYNKSILLDSDFVTMDYNSNSTYVDAAHYIYNALKCYLPLLYGGDKQGGVSYSEGPNDNTALSIKAGDSINELLPAIVGGLVVAPDTSLDLRYDPTGNAISLRGESDAVQYKSWILADWVCDVNNAAICDSLEIKFDAASLYHGTNPVMPNLSIKGGVCDNIVDVEVSYDEKVALGNSAKVALKAELLQNAKTKQRNLHIDVIPSYFYNSAERWDITAQGIDIEPSRVSVNNFLVSRPEQYLSLDGVMSSSMQDSANLTLSNFDLSGFSVFLERAGYSFEGVSNGYAVAKSVFSDPEFEISIALDSLKVNDMDVAPQFISSTWDKVADRAHVVVRDRGLDKSVIDGYYSPKDNSYSADIVIGNADMLLLRPYLQNVLTEMSGKMDIKANISGEGRRAVLSGNIVANAFDATVGYTKARYRAPQAKFTLKDNHILASRVPLYDNDNNLGYLGLDVDLSNLNNVTYDVSAEVNKMLVLNTTASDNDTFYGHVYATGDATFRGDKRGTKIDIDVTSADNSKFYLPLQRKENVSYAEFVKFVEPDVEKIDSIDFLTRIMMSYEREARAVNTTSKVMDINIGVNVLPNIEMQLVIDPTMGDIIKAKGTGELDIHVVPEADIFEMNGDIKISEGTYLFTLQNIINKLFTVVPGSSIHWDGNPRDAEVNIDAVYSTKASLSPLIGSSVQGFDTSHAVPVDCYIKLADKLSSPTPTFDIKVPNVAPEIQTIVQSALNDQHAIATQMFWLLTANSFSADDTGVTGASLSATTGFELLSNQLSNWLSGEDYNIILRYRPRTQLAGDEVDFGFSKSWFNNRLIVELEGGYLSDASAQAMQKASNFVGEAFITWLIDPEGVMRFRGFTQTIDRYGENQGMQESGIGFYYNESFNTFADLRQSLKQRFGKRSEPLKNALETSAEENNNPEPEALNRVENDTLQIENIELINNN